MTGRRAVYLVVVVVVCPLLAYRLAVAGANRHELGVGGFLLILVGIPVVVAGLAAFLLKLGGRRGAGGAVTAVAATLAFVVVLVFITLSR